MGLADMLFLDDRQFHWYLGESIDMGCGCEKLLLLELKFFGLGEDIAAENCCEGINEVAVIFCSVLAKDYI